MMRCGVVAKNTNTRRSSFFSFTSLTLAPVAVRPPDEALEPASRNVLDRGWRCCSGDGAILRRGCWYAPSPDTRFMKLMATAPSRFTCAERTVTQTVALIVFQKYEVRVVLSSNGYRQIKNSNN